jgi:hypothetical protein
VIHLKRLQRTLRSRKRATFHPHSATPELLQLLNFFR